MIAARCDCAVDAKRFARITREKLDRAAQIIRRVGADGARTLRHAHAADVLGDNRAADVQAVGVAIARIAEWNAVERKAKLLLVKPANRNALRPFIGAKGIG